MFYFCFSKNGLLATQSAPSPQIRPRMITTPYTLTMISVALNILFLSSDSSEIPSLWEMQSSLLNDSSEDVLVPLCQSLLISALEDPGCEGPNVSIKIVFGKKSACCLLYSVQSSWVKKVWSAMYFLSLSLKSLTRLNFSDIPFCNSGLVNMFKFSQIILPYVKMGSILTGTNRYYSCKSPTSKKMLSMHWLLPSEHGFVKCSIIIHAVLNCDWHFCHLSTVFYNVRGCISQGGAEWGEFLRSS